MNDRHNMDGIRRQLFGLRLRLRLWQFGVGTSRFLAVVAALVFISLIVDRTARMDHTQRVISLIIGAVALLVVIGREIVRPLRHRISSEALLRSVERRQADLASRLIAAWEFAALPDIPRAPPRRWWPRRSSRAVRRGRGRTSMACSTGRDSGGAPGSAAWRWRRCWRWRSGRRR